MSKKHSRLQSLEIATDGISGTYNDVVSVRDATMNLTKDMIESTTRENGQDHDYIDGMRSRTIDFTAAWDEADSVLMAIVDAYYDNDTLHARWRMDNSGGLRQEKGQVKVASIAKGASSNSLETVDVSLQVCGATVEDTQ